MTIEYLQTYVQVVDVDSKYSYFAYRQTISHFLLIRDCAKSFQVSRLYCARRISEVSALRQQHDVALHQAAHGRFGDYGNWASSPAKSGATGW